jgi:hypothetical protein
MKVGRRHMVRNIIVKTEKTEEIMKTNCLIFLLLLFCSGIPVMAARVMQPGKKSIPCQKKLPQFQKKDFLKDRTECSLREFMSSNSGKILDSIHHFYWSQTTLSWEPNGKTYNTYNSQGNLAQTIYYEIYGTFRAFYEYPGTDLYPQSETFQIWDAGYNKWVTTGFTHYLDETHVAENYYMQWNIQRQKYTYGFRDTAWYDLSGNQIGDIQQIFDTITQAFINYYHWSAVYNNAGEPVELLDQNWDDANQKWINGQKQTWSRDTIEKLTEYNRYSWNNNNSTWSNTEKTKTISAKEYEHTESWNFGSGKWDSLSRSFFTYTPVGLMINSLIQYYDGSTFSWSNSNNTYFSYYVSGNKKEKGDQLWNSLTSQWLTYSYEYYKDDSPGAFLEYSWKDYDNLTYQCTYGERRQFSFDNNDNLIEDIWQYWDVSAEGWLNAYKLTSTYNSQNLKTESIEQDWDAIENIWYDRFKSIYYYSDFNGISEKPAGEKPCYFSNPLSTGEKIECPFFKAGNGYSLSLTDLSGKEVFSSDFTGGDPVIINKSLAPGLYLLQINKKERMIYRDKIIIR